jgi:hypothetical protein
MSSVPWMTSVEGGGSGIQLLLIVKMCQSRGTARP